MSETQQSPIKKPKSAQTIVKPKARTEKQTLDAIHTAIYNGVTKELRFFLHDARISQLASTAIGDLLIGMCNNIIKKAVAVLRLANKKTISGESIRVAAQNILPSISIDAQTGWDAILNDAVWNILDEWKSLKEKAPAMKDEESTSDKVYINEILRTNAIYISATALKRIIKINLPCGWRMENDLPAVALAIVCYQVINIISRRISGDEEYKSKMAKGGLMVAPKHIFKAIQGHLVLPHILGGNINIVNAPQGLLVASTRRHRSRRARSQSPAARGTKRARSPAASESESEDDAPLPLRKRMTVHLPMAMRSPEARAARRAQAEAMLSSSGSESEKSPFMTRYKAQAHARHEGKVSPRITGLARAAAARIRAKLAATKKSAAKKQQNSPKRKKAPLTARGKKRAAAKRAAERAAKP